MPRARIWMLLPLFAGCAKIAGVEDFSVSPAPAGQTLRQEVARFLGGGTCETCIEQQCSSEIDVCTTDRDCAEPAACMGRCSNPACVWGCRGAVVPAPGSNLWPLTTCATKQCKTPCEIGTSWSCAGKYDWPQAPSEPFDVSFSIDIWNDSWDPSPHLAGARVGLCNDRAASPASPTTVCASPWSERTTDDQGHVTLPVAPIPGVRGGTIPPSHFFIGATDASPTQKWPTSDWRVDTDQSLHIDQTKLGGTFCRRIGDTATPGTPGRYLLHLDDAVTRERRSSAMVGIPSEGSVALIVFPPTAEDVQNQ